MMWICPKCEREFNSKNQSHSCVKTTLDDLFFNKPRYIRLMYEKLLSECSKFSRINTDTTLSCIYFVSGQRFLVIKPQASGLILEFVLRQKFDVFPVFKIYALGRGKFVHRLKLDSMEDVNEQIISWIKEAFLILRMD